MPDMNLTSSVENGNCSGGGGEGRGGGWFKPNVEWVYDFLLSKVRAIQNCFAVLFWPFAVEKKKKQNTVIAKVQLSLMV